MKSKREKIKLFILITLVIIGIIYMFLAYNNGWLRFAIVYSGIIIACLVVISRTDLTKQGMRDESRKDNADPDCRRDVPVPDCRRDVPVPIKEEKQKDVRFLVILFLAALLIRIVFSLMIHVNSVDNGAKGYFYKYVYNRGNDDEYYDLTGRAISNAWENGKLLDFPSIMKYRGSVHVGYNIFVGFIYLVCGRNIIFGKLINALLGAMVVVYIFFIGRVIFGRNVARLASILCALDTYMVFFGGFLYKDILITFLCVFSIWHFIKFRNEGSKWSLLYMILAIFFEFFNRSYMGAALAVGVIGYFLVFAAPKEGMRRVIYFVIILVLSSPFVYIFYRLAKSQLTSNVVRVKTEGGKTENTGVGDTRVFSPKRLSKNLLRIFFSPIPWRNLKDSWENVFYWIYPGRLLWYVFLPFFFVGAYYSLRHGFRDVFVPAAVMFSYIVVLMIIMQTAYRHQAPIVPLMFLTASAGFCRVRDPLLPYIIYLPCLSMFFFYDNDMLKPGAIIMFGLGMAFLAYVGIMYLKKRRMTEAESRKSEVGG
ncbi:MAG: glycosyltransferase family 39 protein [Candidatus Eremiobacteraeota bacterium]|nr:glycosyltransferase family 39 protein [Candidatus Eremiobacteraeota bacterium]